jgi:multidrug efflux pump subunit AcrA (membrane-fusion protein)
MKRPVKIALLALLVVALAAGGYYASRLPKMLAPGGGAETPTTRVKRGDVTITVNARGTLQGGNSKMITSPMVGGTTLTLTELAESGQLVKEGDVVAQFDTTDEVYKMREAEADLQEAEQQVKQAENEEHAKEEELNYDLIQARGDLKQAELEVKRNPLLAGITARQNDLALEGARDKLAKLEHDYPARKAAAKASIAIQIAAREKAKMENEIARHNIDQMTVKAPSSGYVNIERNTVTNFYYPGMTLPLFQIGDQPRPGMAVAQIPDMSHWEVSAQIAETDRGHISVGQKVDIRAIALTGKVFHGQIKDLGGTTGSPWDRRFECKMSLDDPAPELRPGMTARVVITMETLRAALWLPAQAVFESDGREFVYARQGKSFTRREVKLVRRSESQVVLTGLHENDEVALASPDEQGGGAEKKGADSATKAVAK